MKSIIKKTRLVAVIMAMVMTFSLSSFTAAADEDAEHNEIGCCVDHEAQIIEDEGGEQTQNNNCNHNWFTVYSTEIPVGDSGYCGGGYLLITDFLQCTRCFSADTKQRRQGTRHVVTVSGGKAYCRLCGVTL